MRRKPLFPPPVSAATQQPKRNKGRQPYTLLTINGQIRLLRTRWHCPLESSCTPLDRYLDEAESTVSRGVREMGCRLNQGAGSFCRAAENLFRAAHIPVSKETLRQLVEEEGRAVQQAQQRAQLLPDWSAADCLTEQGPTRLYQGCDGVKVPLITEEEKQTRRKGVREKRRVRGRKCKPLPRPKPGADCAYKDYKVAYLYDESKQHRYVGVVAGDHEAAGRLMRRMSDQVRLPQADERVAIIDGAPWIRNQIELHGLVDAIGLDFYHLQDNAQKARRIVFGDEAEDGKAWLRDLLHIFKHDGYGAAWDSLVDWRSRLRSPTKRATANHLLQYVAERRDMIRYPEFRAKHWQIGSGPTEAECKTTTSRVKGRGRRWDAGNAEAMMSLAALQDSGMWSQYWGNSDHERN